MEKEYSVTIGGTPLVFRTGKVAKQANGAVMASHGETVILSTACITETARTGIDFFPLLVDFEERYYSAGKIPGGAQTYYQSLNPIFYVAVTIFVTK